MQSGQPDAPSQTLNLTGLRPESVTLVVADLARSRAFYEGVLGLNEIEAGAFGIDGSVRVKLVEEPGARPDDPRTTGLFHFALLVPDRPALGRFLKHVARLGFAIDGAADHWVSEAVYLHDPDGHGIEVYRDRDPSEWTWDGDQVRMASDPLDFDGIIASADDRAWLTSANGTRMGHVHLRVADLNATEAFYIDRLGFDLVCRFPGALFVSVDRYHHHLGLNTWRSRGGVQAEPGTARLIDVEFSLPPNQSVAHLRDPAGIGLTFRNRV